jgi:hypothetical protein
MYIYYLLLYGFAALAYSRILLLSLCIVFCLLPLGAYVRVENINYKRAQ